MSDEFDPGIERLFAQTPAMPDAELFAVRVEQRLNKGSALRALALTAAGVVGGAIAVRESLSVNFQFQPSGADPVAEASQSAASGAGDLIQGVLGQWGMADAAQSLLPAGSLGGMQLFWITAAVVIGLAAVGVVRLSQEA